MEWADPPVWRTGPVRLWRRSLRLCVVEEHFDCAAFFRAIRVWKLDVFRHRVFRIQKLRLGAAIFAEFKAFGGRI